MANADPRLGLAAARLRQLRRRTERAVVEAQALTAHEALAGYTLSPAYAAGEEGVAGRIRVGMRADLTGLAVDPVDAPAEECRTTRSGSRWSTGASPVIRGLWWTA